MKEVLITGSEGFVGHHLWRELENAGYDVYGTVLNPSPNLNPKVFPCDVTNLVATEKLISELRPDAIIHLAGWSNQGSSFANPQKTFEINVIGTINLLESVRKIEGYRPKIVAIGSAAEFGEVSLEKLLINEETLFNPTSPYGVSKVASWLSCKQYVSSYGMDIVYAIPFNHTGPGQATGFLAPDIASQIVAIERGDKEAIILTGNLSPKRDILDVRDVVRAYRLLLEKGIAGERYIISTGKSIQVKAIVDKLLSFSKVEIALKRDESRIRPTEISDSYGDHQKITAATGWQPEIPLDQTLQDLLNYYREKGKI